MGVRLLQGLDLTLSVGVRLGLGCVVKSWAVVRARAGRGAGVEAGANVKFEAEGGTGASALVGLTLGRTLSWRPKKELGLVPWLG